MNYGAAKRARELKTRYLLLKNWYGKERAKVEMAAHSPQPVAAAELMENLCADLASPEIGHFVELQAHWKEIIGAGPAVTLAVPAGLTDGVLHLEVRHSALVRELAPSLDLLLSRINAYFNAEVCREIRLVPAGGTRRR